MSDFSDLVGLTLKNINVNDADAEVWFETEDGRLFVLYHEQDCCESVHLTDVCGDLADLVGVPVLEAREDSNYSSTEYGEECWTFYNISTIKGSVQFRWHGSSNGYYSTAVTFREHGVN